MFLLTALDHAAYIMDVHSFAVKAHEHAWALLSTSMTQLVRTRLFLYAAHIAKKLEKTSEQPISTLHLLKPNSLAVCRL